MGKMAENNLKMNTTSAQTIQREILSVRALKHVMRSDELNTMCILCLKSLRGIEQNEIKINSKYRDSAYIFLP